MSTSERASVLTLGYGRRSPDELLSTLEAHETEYLIDVRSVPWSRYQPAFSRDQLAAALGTRDIRYVFMGDELGGRPDASECYDAEGRVDYQACRRLPAFQKGIDRVARAWQDGHRLVLLCSEGKPESCHRTKLVADALIQAAVSVRHIDERGTLRSQEEILDRLRDGQMTLLGDEASDALTKSRGRYGRAAA